MIFLELLQTRHGTEVESLKGVGSLGKELVDYVFKVLEVVSEPFEYSYNMCKLSQLKGRLLHSYFKNSSKSLIPQSNWIT